ncbi:MAG: Gfo/Idh/MocA family oxidoreductase [Anaerolineales bacterium]|nr:Gfo/Idh/MocA family oxidoreductase [Anaerolineales bacterium]
MKHPDQILRVGGVGTGRIWQFAHARTYPQFIEKAWLTGFHDVNPARAEQARRQYEDILTKYAAEHPQHAERAALNLKELRVYPTLAELLAAVDVVDVATHARGRMAVAIQALEAGVHVMVEKPMCRTWSEGDRAARVAAAHPGALFQLNDDNVFDPKYHAYSDLLAQGLIGSVQHITLIRGSRLDSTTVLKSQANALDNGGGCLMDYGSHGLAAVWSVLGLRFRPVRVEAVSVGVRHRHRVLEDEPFIMEVDDNAQIKVLFEDAHTGAWVTVFLEATWCGGHLGLEPDKPGGQGNGYISIVGDRGVIFSNSGTSITVRGFDGSTRSVPTREYPAESMSFNEQIGTFLDRARAGTPTVYDAAFGAEVIAICGAAYLAALRGRAVTLDEFKAFAREKLARYGDNAHADDAIVLELTDQFKRSAS